MDLPTELIATIFQHLDNASFLAARQASRRLEQASFAVFGKRFFRKKGYMITTPSLDVLQCVASHEKLRENVQHVWFNPDCYTFGPPTEDLMFSDGADEGKNAGLRHQDGYSDEAAKSQERLQAQLALALDHIELMKSDRALADRLGKAFASMPNLKTVGMRRSTDHKPWGWSRVQDAVGRDPRVLGQLPFSSTLDPSGPTLLYIALFQSLAASGSYVRRFYTDVIELDEIESGALPSDVIRKACKSLLYLEVNATKSRANALDHGHLGIAPASPEMLSVYSSGLTQLLAACPTLRELGLMIFRQKANDFEYSLRAFSRLAAQVQLQNLRRIKLEKIVTRSSDLIAILQPSSSNLTSLKLRDIRLFPAPDDDPPTEHWPPKLWKPVFAFLATSCPKLSYFFLHKVITAVEMVRFVEQLPPSSQGANGSRGFVDYENITVEVGLPHNDPDTEGREKRAAIMRARDAVSQRMQSLVEGHWYGSHLHSYDMDEGIWYTDTSDEEW